MDFEEEKLTVLDWGIKGMSKIEIYRILTTEGGVDLPPAKECNYQFIRAIFAGDKKVSSASYRCRAHKRKRCKMNSSSIVQRVGSRRHLKVCSDQMTNSGLLPEVKGAIKYPKRIWMCNIGEFKVQ